MSDVLLWTLKPLPGSPFPREEEDPDEKDHNGYEEEVGLESILYELSNTPRANDSENHQTTKI